MQHFVPYATIFLQFDHIFSCNLLGKISITILYIFAGEVPTPIDVDEQDATETTASLPSLTRQITLPEETTFGKWLKSTFTLTDKDLEERCGYDALQYVRFERYVIFYLIVVTVLCIGVVLPLNFQGDLQVIVQYLQPGSECLV